MAESKIDVLTSKAKLAEQAERYEDMAKVRTRPSVAIFSIIPFVVLR